MIWENFSDIYKKAKTIQVQVAEQKEPLHLKDSVAIEEGSRDDKMLVLANSLLARNYNELEVWETINQVNRTYSPPLDESSMQRIFRQATNFIAASKSSATSEITPIGKGGMSQRIEANSHSGTGNAKIQMSQGVNQHGMPDPILLADLSAEENAVQWICPGFIARGHKTLLSALFKAGKSTWIGSLLKALGEGKEFLGFQTIPCNVLVLSEESKTQWVERREELELRSQIYILPNPMKYKLSYLDWVGWLEETKKFCKEKEIGLVIVDTISEFWSVNDENKAPEVTQALMPLNYLTEDNIAVLLVHHFRKSGGTQGVAARGSGALASKVDILIDFTRYEDNEETTKRRLSCLSRFQETPRELIVDYINSEYVVLGNSAEVQEKEKIADLLAIFNAYPKGFTVREVLDNWDSSDGGKKPAARTIQRYIVKLIKEKQIEKVENKEINGKSIPFYKIINRQNNHDISAAYVEIDENVAGEKIGIKPITTIEIDAADLGNKQIIEGIIKGQEPVVYLGKEAVNKLIAYGILQHGQETCQNQFKTAEEKLWVDNGSGGRDWVDAEKVKCGQFLFWQIGDSLPQCSTCNPWSDNHKESEITAWYQTKENKVATNASSTFEETESKLPKEDYL